MSSVFTKARSLTSVLQSRFPLSVCQKFNGPVFARPSAAAAGQQQHEQRRYQHHEFMTAKDYEKKTNRRHVSRRDDVGILGVPLRHGQVLILRFNIIIKSTMVEWY